MNNTDAIAMATVVDDLQGQIDARDAEIKRLRAALSDVFIFEADSDVVLKKAVWNRLWRLANGRSPKRDTGDGDG